MQKSKNLKPPKPELNNLASSIIRNRSVRKESTENPSAGLLQVVDLKVA